MQALPMMMMAGMSMMNKPKSPPAAQPPARMPDPNGPEVVEARRRKMSDMAATKGRASTNLTGNMPTAAPTFSNSTLGQ